MILNALKKIAQAKELEQELHTLQAEINKLKNKKQEIENIIDNRNQYLNKLNSQLYTKEAIILSEDLGISYEPSKYIVSELEENINKTKTEIAKNLKDNKYVILSRKYTVDNSTVKGEKFIKSFCENNILGFNLYCEKKLKTLTEQNFYRNMELIEKKFNQFSNKINIIGGSFNTCYLDLVKTWMQAELDLKITKKQEQERIKEEKRKLREEQQLLAEAEKERKKLEAERVNLQKLFAKAVTEQEQNEINAKLAKVDSRIEEVDWRVSHYSAGWLYITTTPSMPGIMKIGCTRQLNPLNRLAQLSSASVPFPFECRGLVFSEDVFALEAKMHNRLDSKRVNKDNKLKEFFYGEPEEAIKILTDELHEDVKFIDEHWVGNGKENDNEID